jgi:hypothetical protein
MVRYWEGSYFSVRKDDLEVIDYNPFQEIPDGLLGLEVELYGGAPDDENRWNFEPLSEEFDIHLEDRGENDLKWYLAFNTGENYRVGFLAEREEDNFVFYSMNLEKEELRGAAHLFRFHEVYDQLSLEA